MKKLNLFNLLVIIIFFISCSKQEIQKSEITEKFRFTSFRSLSEGMKSLEEEMFFLLQKNLIRLKFYFLNLNGHQNHP